MAVYLLAAILGVALVVASTWALGGVRTARLPGTESAVSLMRRDHGAYSPSETELSADATAALLCSDSGAVGLVFAMGEHFATRELAPGDIRFAEADERGALHLGFRDLGSPDPTIRLASGDRARLWGERLSPLAAARDPGGGA
jgi:hypothetical protein